MLRAEMSPLATGQATPVVTTGNWAGGMGEGVLLSWHFRLKRAALRQKRAGWCPQLTSIIMEGTFLLLPNSFSKRELDLTHVNMINRPITKAFVILIQYSYFSI